MSAPTIADHGLIGDLRTTALVASDGSIDWFCPHRFDDPSVFAAILDERRGGRWRIAPPEDDHRVTQFYFPDTNVLITRFMTDTGVVELQDFMPVGEGQRIVRRVSCVRGEMTLRGELAARFDYGRREATLTRREGGVSLDGDQVSLTLLTDAQLDLADQDVTTRFELGQGETLTFVLHVGEVRDPRCHQAQAAQALFDETVAYWRDWLSGSTYTGRWREMVHRSALTLKLLTYAPTGAIIAAPTTSLPEALGEERNWDYRFAWMRDAAFTVYALLRLGFTEEARAFNAFTAARLGERGQRQDGPPLQTMYCVDGTADLAEETLDHLAGHRGTRPVRIGNAAATQLQLDIYGELIDSIYLYDRYGSEISHDTWEALCEIVEWLADNWDRPDGGIWEIRDGERNHVFSRLMCWVGIERMVRIARHRGLPADVVRWTSIRDDIYRQIMTRGWDRERGAFRQYLDDGGLDASLLLMPMVKFCSPRDPRFLSTLEAIESELVADSLVYRYAPTGSDGVSGTEGTFSICSFWYVEALTRAGRLDDARLALEKMFTYANHLGLYAEQISPSGEQRGNFPQGFTHFALISAAYNLDRALVSASG